MTAPVCILCGGPAEWWLRLDCPRKTDPPNPSPACHRCIITGPYRRRNKTIWLIDPEATTNGG